MEFRSLFIILLFLNAFVIESLGQSKSADSLKNILHQQSDSIKLNSYKSIINDIEKIAPDSALRYATLAIELAQNTNSFIQLGNIYYERGQIYHRLNKYSEAVNDIKKSIDYAIITHDSSRLYYRFNLLGKIHNKFGNYPDAIAAQLKALSIENNIPNHILYIAYNDLGNVYRKTEDLELALKYYTQSLQILETRKDWKRASVVYNNIGLIYRRLNDTKTALLYHNKALVHTDSSFYAALSLQNIGEIYYQLKNYDSAEYFYLKALKIKERLNKSQSLLYTLEGLAQTYIGQNKLQQAKKFAIENYQASLRSKKNERIASSSGTLSRYYKKVDDYQNALKYYELQVIYSDSLFNADKAQEIGRLNAAYEMRNVALENKLLKSEQEKNEAVIATQKDRITIITLTLILSAVIIIGLYVSTTIRNKRNLKIQKQKTKLESTTKKLLIANEKINNYNKNLEIQVNERTATLLKTNTDLSNTKKELDLFLYRSSHDLRRPLTTLMGLNEVSKLDNDSSSDDILFEKVMETAGNLDKILNNLMTVSIINNEDTIDEVSQNEIKSIAQKFIPSNFKFNFHSEIQSVKTNLTLLELILRNSIENAVSFNNKDEPAISLGIDKNNFLYSIVLQDNGIGIDETVIDKVFDMYFVGTVHSKGNGLGLYIVRKAVEKLNGTFEIDSEENIFTKLTIKLPFIDKPTP